MAAAPLRPYVATGKPRPCKICKRSDHNEVYCPKRPHRLVKTPRICPLCCNQPWRAKKPKCPKCGQVFRDR